MVLGQPGHVTCFKTRLWKGRHCRAILEQHGSGTEETTTLCAFVVSSWISQGKTGDVFKMLMLRAPALILNQLSWSGVQRGLQCDAGGKPKLRITILNPRHSRCDPHPSPGVPWKLAQNEDSQARPLRRPLNPHLYPKCLSDFNVPRHYRGGGWGSGSKAVSDSDLDLPGC